LKLAKVRFGPDHPNTLTSMCNLANGYRVAGQLDRALPLFEESLARRKATLGPDHPSTITGIGYLSLGYLSARDFDRALPLLEEILTLRKAKLGLDHPHTLSSMSELADGYMAAGKLDRALPLFEESLARKRAKLGPDAPSTLLTMGNLAGGYERAGRLDRAVALRRELADIGKRTAGADSPQYVGALASLSRDLLEQEKWTEAETVLRETLTTREAKQPDDWATFNTKSMLGGALLGQEKYAAAEPLLKAGYEGIKLRAARIPPQGKPRLAEALDRLIKLAEATNKPDEARMWKEERAKLPGATASKPEAANP
jgi:hypothetical protein